MSVQDHENFEDNDYPARPKCRRLISHLLLQDEEGMKDSPAPESRPGRQSRLRQIKTRIGSEVIKRVRIRGNLVSWCDGRQLTLHAFGYLFCPRRRITTSSAPHIEVWQNCSSH